MQRAHRWQMGDGTQNAEHEGMVSVTHALESTQVTITEDCAQLTFFAACGRPCNGVNRLSLTTNAWGRRMCLCIMFRVLSAMLAFLFLFLRVDSSFVPCVLVTGIP